MYRYFFILTLFLCSNWIILQAEENIERINVCYLIPQIPCEFVTNGEIHVLKEGELKFWGGSKNWLSFDYEEKNKNFRFCFGAPADQILQVGVYKQARRSPDSKYESKLDIGGCGRGYNNLYGEFEVLDIQYDENDKLVSFAADFSIFSYQGDELIVRGLIRFNSSIPINDYFVKMTDPEFNWKSEQLIYIVRKDCNHNEEKFIAEDRSEISTYIDQYTTHDYYPQVINTGIKFSESNNLDIGLYIAGFKRPFSSYKGIIFHLDFNPLKYDENEDVVNLLIQLKYECQMSIHVSDHLLNSGNIKTQLGCCMIYELKVDSTTNQLKSLAADFVFKDEAGIPYKGFVRFHSQVPVPGKTTESFLGDLFDDEFEKLSQEELGDAIDIYEYINFRR